MGPLSLAPMIPYLIKAFDSNLTDVIQFTGVAILVLGFSNFIWYALQSQYLLHGSVFIDVRVPLSTSFGRRPVYLASLLICFGSAIWRAKAQTYGSFMGACVLNGIAAGPAETIQPNVIADVMFLHERGTYQTLYFAFYFGSLMVCLFILLSKFYAYGVLGRTYHRWADGRILRMAELLVAQCRSHCRYLHHVSFRVSGNKVSPRTS